MADLPPPPPTLGSSLQSSLSASLAKVTVDEKAKEETSGTTGPPSVGVATPPMTFDFKPFGVSSDGDAVEKSGGSDSDDDDNDEDYFPQPGDNNLNATDIDVPQAVVDRINHLQSLHEKREEIQEEYQKARTELELVSRGGLLVCCGPYILVCGTKTN